MVAAVNVTAMTIDIERHGLHGFSHNTMQRNMKHDVFQDTAKSRTVEFQSLKIPEIHGNRIQFDALPSSSTSQKY